MASRAQRIGYPEVVRLEVRRPSSGPCRTIRPSETLEAPLFSTLSLTDREQILSAAREKSYAAGETIFLEGEPVRQMSLLTSGHVKMTQLSQNGSEVILRVCGTGEAIEVYSQNSLTTHCSSARAIQSSTALVWGANVFEALLLRYPALGRNISQILCERLLKMEERFREISTEKVAVRLSKEILRLLKQVGRSSDGGVEIRLSREELAQLTGTTVFTVSRLLSKWERCGIVSSQTQNRSVRVSNLQELERLSYWC